MEKPKEEPKQERKDCFWKKPDFNVLKGICNTCGNSIIHLGEKIEVSKQETLEQALYNEFVDNSTINTKDREVFIKGGLFGAKWQQARSYSEEDLREAFKGGGKMSWTDINQETQEPYYYDFNEWFEQFKKK